MRERLCKACRKWHPVDDWPIGCFSVSDVARSDTIGVPYFISDSIEPMTSMADGRIYSSKAALRATYREDGNPQGIRYTEVGNEPIREPVKQKSTVMESLKRVKEQMNI